MCLQLGSITFRQCDHGSRPLRFAAQAIVPYGHPIMAFLAREPVPNKSLPIRGIGRSNTYGQGQPSHNFSTEAVLVREVTSKLTNSVVLLLVSWPFIAPNLGQQGGGRNCRTLRGTRFTPLIPTTSGGCTSAIQHESHDKPNLCWAGFVPLVKSPLTHTTKGMAKLKTAAGPMAWLCACVRLSKANNLAFTSPTRPRHVGLSMADHRSCSDTKGVRSQSTQTSSSPTGINTYC